MPQAVEIDVIVEQWLQHTEVLTLEPGPQPLFLHDSLREMAVISMGQFWSSCNESTRNS